MTNREHFKDSTEGNGNYPFEQKEVFTIKDNSKQNREVLNDDKPTAIDLFCGCGGLTEGLKSAGFRVLAAVECDTLAAKTYKANHRDVVVWEKNIKALDPNELRDILKLQRGKLDLVAGGPPCQGFSVMQRFNSKRMPDDERNDLVFEFMRFIEALLPRAVMMENVPPMASDERFRIFTKKLETIGYRGTYRVLNAADYGVPQRRRRLIYLAGHGFTIPFPEGSNKIKTVEDAIGGLPKAGTSGDPLHDLPERRSQRVMEIIRCIPKDGGSFSDLPIDRQRAFLSRDNVLGDAYGRLAWKDVAPTITGGCSGPSRGRFLHPMEDRAITMREAALLQGFSQWYKFPILKSKTAIALMIGNALPPPFVAAIARSIKQVLQNSTGT